MRLSSTISRLALAAVLATAAGCASGASDTGASSDAIKTLTQAQALDDFDQVVSSFRALYGAMDRKQAKYGFDFESMAKDYRGRVAAAATEGEVFGLYTEFIARFHDPHVWFDRNLTDDASGAFWLPFDVQHVEDSFVVSNVSAPLDTQIHPGDELLSLDGQSSADLAALFAKYAGVANTLALQQVAAHFLTVRSSYLPTKIDPTLAVKLRLRAADGSEREVDATWNRSPHALEAAAPPPIPQAGETDASNAVAFSGSVFDVAGLGAREPFFVTDAVKKSLADYAEVTPSEESAKKFSLSPANLASVNYFAATYTSLGKRVLLVRLPSYAPASIPLAIRYLEALFFTFQSQVDALVFDETHNPGGQIVFASEVASLLAKGTYDGMVERVHADRKWIGTFTTEAAKENANGVTPLGQAMLDDARATDAANNAGQSLSAPIPPFLPMTNTVKPDSVHWTKPAMVLVDEMSVSCADFVPLLVKANKMATLFGQTTMGGGGNVEAVATLNNTQAVLHISRALMTVFDPTGAYPESSVIEDNGVRPDIVHAVTVADVRAGYVGYAAHMNAALADTIAASAPLPVPATH